MAYPSVVAGGKDSCTIHYLRNNKAGFATPQPTWLSYQECADKQQTGRGFVWTCGNPPSTLISDSYAGNFPATLWRHIEVAWVDVTQAAI